MAVSWTSAGDPEERIWNFEYPAAANMFNTATDSLGLSGMTKHVTVEPASIVCAGSELCKKVKNEVNGELSAESQDTTKNSRLATDYHSLSLSRYETSWKHSRDVPRLCW